MHLEFYNIDPRGRAISDLSACRALPSLEHLSMIDMSIEDEDVEAIIPSLPRLRSLNVSACRFLTCRVLDMLPASLDLLDVMSTAILAPPPDTGAMDYSRRSSSARKGMRTVKSLVAVHAQQVNNSLPASACFDRFLNLFDETSILLLNLSNSPLNSNDFICFISNTPHLIKLGLRHIDAGLDENAFNAISQLASLQELDLDSAVIDDDCLSILANGPCRKSLRRIDLTDSTLPARIVDIAGTRRLFSERFDRCNIIL